MRNAVQSVIAGALIALGAGQFSAHAASTNVVQDLTIKFTAYYQMDPTTNSTTIFRNAGKASVVNKDIISLLGLQLNVVFSSSAKLMLKSDSAGSIDPKIIVRDTVAGQTVDTAVGQYFNVAVTESVENTKTKLSPINVSGTGYDVLVFNMAVDTAHFSVQGFAQTTISTVKYQGQVVGEAHTGSMNVSGNGTYAASPAGGVAPVAITGTVKVSGKNVEVSTP